MIAIGEGIGENIKEIIFSVQQEFNVDTTNGKVVLVKLHNINHLTT